MVFVLLGDLKLPVEFLKLMIWLLYLVSYIVCLLPPFKAVTTASW
jgi:hypothetical protein